MERSQPNDTVVLYEGDTSLKQKLGSFLLETLFTPQIIEDAQQIVAAMAPALLAEMDKDLDVLEARAKLVKPGVQAATVLPGLGAAAFSIKSRAGLCDYALVSALARSLTVFCDMTPRDQTLTRQEVDIVACLAKALKTVFTLRVTGMGGETGNAIAAELKRLAIQFQN